VRNTIIPETEKPLVHCSVRAPDIIPRDIAGETTGAPICQGKGYPESVTG
jgi:hypothetical protein